MVEVTPRKDHLTVFRLITELDFPLGKKLLIQVLRGEENARVKKHDLHKKIHHGTLGGYDEDDLRAFIDFLIKKDYLEIEQKDGRYPVIFLTEKARKEMIESKIVLRVDDIHLLYQLIHYDYNTPLK